MASRNEESPGLLGLPEELLHLVASYLSHPDDLKSLCLSCSGLRQAAMAALYREFEIDLDEVGIDDAILTTDHAIHKHIKQLIVVHRLMPFRKDPNYEVRWSEKLRLLLERLPRDKLESVCTPRSTELSQALLDLMFSRQRNLKYIQLGPGHKLQNISVPQLPRLEALEIPAHIGPLENLRFYQTLLSQNRNIKGLSVRAQHYDVRPGHTLPVDRGVEQPSNVFPRIFGHRPLELKRLLLCTQKLFDAETTLTPYIPFERLHELHFLDCDGIGQMLSLLGNRFKSTGSALQLLSLHAYTSNVVSNLDMAALEGFLESFKGLRFLEIRWDDIIRPDFHIRCLEGHMPTLTDLNLSFMKDEHRHKWFMNQHDVEKLFQMAPNLRQVALPLRDVNPYGRRGLSAVLETILSASTNLRVLRQLNWPLEHNAPPGLRYGLPRQDVDEIANSVMQYIARPGISSALKLFVVGDWRPYDLFYVSEGEEGDQVNECVCYFPGTRTTCFGRTETVGVRVAPRAVRSEYPFWDIYSSDYSDDGCLGAGDYNLLGRSGPFTRYYS